ncbi:cysteine dioxygenase [Azorhizobium doebereinerae]|uniref:cysteine dioxygenase n=1 Tax=Azorhizobium doebereinerae TaxID=281091 RepID=UPI0003F52441|nr:cysteine dioxygenase family protein [Azorhizobium doebereinerae]
MNAPLELRPAEMLTALVAASSGSERDYLDAARATLARYVAHPALLDGVPLTRTPGQYSRNFVFGDADVSVWAMVWPAGARTSIHDHHCSCCFAVLSGTLAETYFEPVGAGLAQPRHQALRSPGFIACMMPSGPNLHRMENLGTAEAVSLHIYGYDHRRHASSVANEYRHAAG